LLDHTFGRKEITVETFLLPTDAHNVKKTQSY